MHVVDGFGILHVLSAPLGQKLLTESGHEVPEVRVGRQLAVLARKLDAHFNLVADWCYDGQDKSLSLPECSRHVVFKSKI